MAYRLQGDNLVRAYWPVLTGWATRSLLLKRFSKTSMTSNFCYRRRGEEHKFWPPVAMPEGSSAALSGLILRISMSPVGIVERVWEVPDG